ncbi:hypothetical protein Hanom_Chr15g01401931 [Helianthus anomalus]
MLFLLEPRVSLEAASLSLGIEARSVYIPPSPDPIGRDLLGMVVVVFIRIGQRRL